MRIAVISDSHGAAHFINEVIEAEPTAETIIFLGDGIRDIKKAEEKYFNKKFYYVMGNCDYFTVITAPKSYFVSIGEKKIFMSHGDEFNVKYGMENLYYKALETGADIVLYGHTHKQKTEYVDGVYFINPGALRNRKYAVIDIEDNGIMCIEKELEY